MPGSSRAWFVDRYGGPERLVLVERPDPVPDPGEVLVKTAATGLNLSISSCGELRRAADGLFDLWKSGRIRPILGPRFDFADLPRAHQALAGRSTTGKVLIKMETNPPLSF